MTTTSTPLSMVRLVGTGSRVMIWSYFVTMAVLAFWSIDDVANPAPTFIALILFAGMCIAVDRDSSAVLDVGTTVFVVALWPFIAALVSWQLELAGGYAQWFLGAGTVSYFFISLRGRVWAAWIGFGALCAVTIVWGLTTPFGVGTALLLVAKQVPILIVGTLFAVGLQRTSRNIARVSAEESARAIAEAATRATIAQRDRALATLDAFATPLLERIVDGAPLTPADRLEFAVAEAELRDGVRARGLSVPRVTEAARRARRHGVDVVLLDDSEPASLDPADLDATIARVSDVLSQASEGRIVARLLPPGRADAATLLIESSTGSRHEVIERTRR
jgi:hypothetical protein